MSDEEEDVCAKIDACKEIEVVLVPPQDGLDSDHDDANSDNDEANFINLGRGIFAQSGEVRGVTKSTEPVNSEKNRYYYDRCR